MLGDETDSILYGVESERSSGESQHEYVFDSTAETKSQGSEEGIEFIGVEFANLFRNMLPLNRRQKVESIYLALQCRLALVLARGYVDSFARECLQDGFVRTVGKMEVVGPKLSQRSFGKDATKHCA